MARDVRGVDWINDRPVTEYMLQMVGMNLPYEQQFFKHTVLKAYHDGGLKGRVDAPILKRTLESLYEEFNDWLASNRMRYETTPAKFGVRMTKLVRSEERHTGFRGLTKVRLGQGVVYKLDVRRLTAELAEQRWATDEEV